MKKKEKQKGDKLDREEVKKKKLAQLIKEGAIAGAERDLEMAKEWFPVEEEI